MKLLRIVLLVLLAALLPVRGAVAGTMLCHAIGVAGAPAAAPHDHTMHGDHAGHGEHGKHATHATHATHAGPHAAGACQFCMSGCCMASLLLALPSIASPGVTASVRFPPLAVPAPAFVSGGPERPPRTL